MTYQRLRRAAPQEGFEATDWEQADDNFEDIQGRIGSTNTLNAVPNGAYARNTAGGFVGNDPGLSGIVKGSGSLQPSIGVVGSTDGTDFEVLAPEQFTDYFDAYRKNLYY